MVQVVSHQPVTSEAWVHAQVSPCGICGGSALGQIFFRFFPVSIISPWLCIIIYHLGDEQ
jgi:hypothetical protein